MEPYVGDTRRESPPPYEFTYDSAFNEVRDEVIDQSRRLHPSLVITDLQSFPDRPAQVFAYDEFREFSVLWAYDRKFRIQQYTSRLVDSLAVEVLPKKENLTIKEASQVLIAPVWRFKEWVETTTQTPANKINYYTAGGYLYFTWNKGSEQYYGRVINKDIYKLRHLFSNVYKQYFYFTRFLEAKGLHYDESMSAPYKMADQIEEFERSKIFLEQLKTYDITPLVILEIAKNFGGFETLLRYLKQGLDPLYSNAYNLPTLNTENTGGFIRIMSSITVNEYMVYMMNQYASQREELTVKEFNDPQTWIKLFRQLLGATYGSDLHTAFPHQKENPFQINVFPNMTDENDPSFTRTGYIFRLFYFLQSQPLNENVMLQEALILMQRIERLKGAK